MILVEQLGGQLLALGYRHFAGVPCSYLKSLINYAENHGAYISAANEGDAAAICAGYYLGGEKAVLLCQNSGLSNALSPLSSLTQPYRIPLLMFIGLRGEPNKDDEPQHEIIGKHTIAMLEQFGIAWDYLSDDAQTAGQQLHKAQAHIERQQSFAFLVRKGLFSEYELKTETTQQKNKPLQRGQILECLQQQADDKTVLLSTTGYTSRELYSLADRDNQFYMVGSMGCASSIGLGIALAQPKLKVIVIDGDGALLMRLGALATVAQQGPQNLLHIVLANDAHESTGGQSLATKHCDFAQLAHDIGYTQTWHANSLAQVDELLMRWQTQPQLTCLQIDMQCGVITKLARPDIHPAQLTTRFRNWVRQQDDGNARLPV